MALDPKSLSVHNRLMGTRIPHPLSTQYHDNDDDDFPSPPTKRLRTATSSGTPSPQRSSPRKPPQGKRIKDEVPDSEDEGDAFDAKEDHVPQATQLEATLPPVQTDEEAIEAYEAYKAGEHVDKEQVEAQSDEDTAQSRLESRKWTRGRSSIYVDAFNLALDT